MVDRDDGDDYGGEGGTWQLYTIRTDFILRAVLASESSYRLGVKLSPPGPVQLTVVAASVMSDRRTLLIPESGVPRVNSNTDYQHPWLPRLSCTESQRGHRVYSNRYGPAQRRSVLVDYGLIGGVGDCSHGRRNHMVGTWGVVQVAINELCQLCVRIVRIHVPATATNRNNGCDGLHRLRLTAVLKILLSPYQIDDAVVMLHDAMDLP